MNQIFLHLPDRNLLGRNILPLIKSHCTKKSDSEYAKKPADSYFSMHRGLTRITKKKLCYSSSNTAIFY